MLIQFVISTAMVLLTVAIHGAGLLGLARLLRLEQREEAETHISPVSVQGILVTFAVVVCLFSLHGVAIWLYAGLYLLLNALPDFETAIYFSTITYSTIGYDDKGLDKAWRLIAAIEGINGIILLGWSTAFFVSLVGRLRPR